MPIMRSEPYPETYRELSIWSGTLPSSPNSLPVQPKAISHDSQTSSPVAVNVWPLMEFSHPLFLSRLEFLKAVFWALYFFWFSSMISLENSLYLFADDSKLISLPTLFLSTPLLCPSTTSTPPAPRPLLAASLVHPPIGRRHGNPSPFLSSRKGTSPDHLSRGEKEKGRETRAYYCRFVLARVFWREIAPRPCRSSIRPAEIVTTRCSMNGEWCRWCSVGVEGGVVACMV